MTEATYKPIVSVREAASELGLSVRAVQYRIAKGQLAATRYGSAYYIARSELARVKAQKPATPSV